jgi:hypothetical protein
VIRPPMIWHIAGPPDLLSHARNSQPGSRCSPPDPGSCLSTLHNVNQLVQSRDESRPRFWSASLSDADICMNVNSLHVRAIANEKRSPRTVRPGLAAHPKPGASFLSTRGISVGTPSRLVTSHPANRKYLDWRNFFPLVSSRHNQLHGSHRPKGTQTELPRARSCQVGQNPRPAGSCDLCDGLDPQ